MSCSYMKEKTNERDPANDLGYKKPGRILISSGFHVEIREWTIVLCLSAHDKAEL